MGMDLMNRLFSNDFGRCASSRDLGLRLVDRAPRLKDRLIVEAAGAGASAPTALARRSACERNPFCPRTLAAQALGKIDEATRARRAADFMSSTTFLRDPDNLYRSGNVYGRPDNETVREAEAVIGALEGAAETLVFGSGMSAAIALFLSLGAGAHVVAPTVMYWALRNWLARTRPASASTVDFVDTEDFAALERAVQPGVARSSSGWRRRAIRSGASATSPTPPDSPMRRARLSRSIRPARRRSSPGRSRSAPTSSCIRRPNISTAIPTSSPARSASRATMRCSSAFATSARPWADPRVRSRPFC